MPVFLIKKILIPFTDSVDIIAKFNLLSFIKPKNFAAHILNLFQRMRNEDRCCTTAHHFFHFLFALFSECSITDG